MKMFMSENPVYMVFIILCTFMNVTFNFDIEHKDRVFLSLLLNSLGVKTWE